MPGNSPEYSWRSMNLKVVSPNGVVIENVASQPC